MSITFSFVQWDGVPQTTWKTLDGYSSDEVFLLFVEPIFPRPHSWHCDMSWWFSVLKDTNADSQLLESCRRLGRRCAATVALKFFDYSLSHSFQGRSTIPGFVAYRNDFLYSETQMQIRNFWSSFLPFVKRAARWSLFTIYTTFLSNIVTCCSYIIDSEGVHPLYSKYKLVANANNLKT